MKLDRTFFLREDTIEIARDLLGKLIVVPDEMETRISGTIVETEVYGGVTDKASHSYEGRRTSRNEVTFGVGGRVYIFMIYGMYYQLNFVTGPIDHPNVVLIRAVEPIEGIETMRERRGPMADKNLSSGPGKLCIAFGIDRQFNGASLEGGKIWVEHHRTITASEIASGKRIGIDYAEEDANRPWRFWLKGNEYVSRVPRN